MTEFPRTSPPDGCETYCRWPFACGLFCQGPVLFLVPVIPHYLFLKIPHISPCEFHSALPLLTTTSVLHSVISVKFRYHS
uniref:Uncharacterized protein n=1 Tax=Anguilla anguilla TaxID=7936 RepID=A0A0E9T5X1_ANGAN